MFQRSIYKILSYNISSCYVGTLGRSYYFEFETFAQIQTEALNGVDVKATNSGTITTGICKGD